MRRTKRVVTRAAAVILASGLALATAGAPAQAQEESGVSLDSSLTLLDTSVELQGGGGNLGNIADLLGSLSGVAEGDMTAMQMVDAMSSFYQTGGLDLLSGIPGSFDDFVKTCMRAIAGEATIDDVWRQFNAIGAPQQWCNDESASGGYEGIYRRIELGRRGPMVIPFRYDTVWEPDTVRVLYEGRVIFEDRHASTGGDRWVDIHVPPGTSTGIQVEVIANDSRTTLWDFTVHCPR